MPGTLWICATPIGNLGDCSQRLRDTFAQADLIAAEDTRVTQKLLAHFGLKKPLLSLQKFNEAQRVHTLIDKLNTGQNIALVSDAGTPNIADPGALVVAKIREAGFTISPIPGPSALTAFLSVCGTLTNQFYFAGFLPRKAAELVSVTETAPEAPFVFFEAANRLDFALETLHNARPIARLTLAKELTKTFETLITGTFEGTLTQFKALSPKGEWLGLIDWAPTPPKPLAPVIAHLKTLGLSTRQIIGVATTLLNYPKNQVYDECHHDD